MKLHPYDIISNDFDFDMYIKSLKITNKLNKKYDTCNFSYKQQYLMNILKYGSPDGKNILDLGCGTIDSPDNCFGTGLFEPWLARALSEIGAKVIGIDKYASLEEKLFTEYKIDLTKDDSLGFLKSKSIDIACMNAFLDAPSLQIKPKEMMKIILPQLERIVKDDGVFIYESFML